MRRFSCALGRSIILIEKFSLFLIDYLTLGGLQIKRFDQSIVHKKRMATNHWLFNTKQKENKRSKSELKVADWLNSICQPSAWKRNIFGRETDGVKFCILARFTSI